MPQDTWTILKLIRWTDERFKKEGLTSPRLDAEVLLAESLGMDRVGLYTHFDQPLQPRELTRFKKRIQRRLAREPLAYIVGKREFWSLTFKVTADVLIPRPETEVLVAEALQVLVDAKRPTRSWRILEIGTGSGAVSIALAKELPLASLVATDLSGKALAIARENALGNGVQERIQFLQGDLFAPLEEGSQFELILSNPPYVPRSHFASLAPEVRDFEPRVALDGGKDGLAFFRRALPRVGEFLQPEGWFLAEIGAGQDPEVRKIAAENPDLDAFDFIPDLAGIKRVFKARKR
ncbi:MAG: peptide chain release factor N(5)-glutamine methyltransferase [Deltaproteobacteria bacterium]|nr:peptide chain release factor N(5)-glutamine methyltransferase [Deltaproteobacteria bacterium]